MRAPAPVILALALLLSGCAGQTPPPPSSAGPAPQTPAPPAATPTAQPLTATIPAECTEVVDPATYAATFGEVPLVQGDGLGRVTPTPPPAGATYREIVVSGVELQCEWDDPASDFNFLGLSIGTVTPNVGNAYLDQLEADGYRCEEALEGRRCQRVTGVEGYEGVEEGSTWFLRDDVFIEVGQVSFPTSGFLAAVVDRVWS